MHIKQSSINKKKEKKGEILNIYISDLCNTAYTANSPIHTLQCIK